MEEVLVYNMVALGTTDVTMSSMAGEKMLFLGALMQQAKEHLLENVLQEMEEEELQRKFADSDLGEDEEEDDKDDDEDNNARRQQAASKRGKSTSMAVKKGRRKRQADPGMEDIEDGRQQEKSSRGKRKAKETKAKRGKKRNATAIPESSNESDDNEKVVERNKGKAKALESDDHSESSKVQATQSDKATGGGDEMAQPVVRNQTAADGPEEEIAGISSTSPVFSAAGVVFQDTEMSTANRLQAISLGIGLAKPKRKANSPAKDDGSEIKKKRLLSPDVDVRMSSPPLVARTAGPSHHQPSQETIDSFPASSRATTLSLFTSSDEDSETDSQRNLPSTYKPAPRLQVRPQPLPLQSSTLGQQQGRALTQEQVAYEPQSFSFRGTNRHHKGSARGTFKC